MSLEPHGPDAKPHSFSASSKHHPDIQRFLDRFCRALTHADTAKIVSCWDVPALVLSDNGVHAVATSDEIAAFFGRAKEQYNAAGVDTTRPEIERSQWMTDKLVSVDVRWPWIDARGAEMHAERSSYVLRLDEHGHLRIRVAIMRG